ncbi:conserved hypothetical protein [Trichinella spiralis]|uniref:hypothetical protein n=1 Tax=Trichinella spiralis TaxID=6334 RepID=UPI0001EFD212|nr:conserved hypothetical protein [Trichinella spiralis]
MHHFIRRREIEDEIISVAVGSFLFIRTWQLNGSSWCLYPMSVDRRRIKVDFMSNTETARLTFPRSMKAGASNSRNQSVECMNLKIKLYVIQFTTVQIVHFELYNSRHYLDSGQKTSKVVIRPLRRPSAQLHCPAMLKSLLLLLPIDDAINTTSFQISTSSSSSTTTINTLTFVQICEIWVRQIFFAKQHRQLFEIFFSRRVRLLIGVDE